MELATALIWTLRIILPILFFCIYLKLQSPKDEEAPVPTGRSYSRGQFLVYRKAALADGAVPEELANIVLKDQTQAPSLFVTPNRGRIPIPARREGPPKERGPKREGAREGAREGRKPRESGGDGQEQLDSWEPGREESGREAHKGRTESPPEESLDASRTQLSVAAPVFEPHVTAMVTGMPDFGMALVVPEQMFVPGAVMEAAPEAYEVMMPAVQDFYEAPRTKLSTTARVFVPAGIPPPPPKPRPAEGAPSPGPPQPVPPSAAPTAEAPGQQRTKLTATAKPFEPQLAWPSPAIGGCPEVDSAWDAAAVGAAQSGARSGRRGRRGHAARGL